MPENFVRNADRLMASALALYLRAEIERRGWTDAELADRAGIQRSTLYKLLNTPGQVPKLETLAALAQALEVDLARLVTLCGFPVGQDVLKSQADQVAMLLETVPELQGFFDILAVLRPEDIRAIRAYAEGMRRTRQKVEKTE